jgi:phosphatidylinositol alpha-mannosyltransferase
VRVALVSPYSLAYPGGVARHVEALAEELLARGHEARVLAPDDPDDRLSRALHRGVRPTRSQLPDYAMPLGRTIAVSANGARSNLALAPESLARLSRELRRGGYDVVHVHEPNAPLVSWGATEFARGPLLGTFHAHSTSRAVNHLAANLLGARRLYNRLSVRIAVSEAARWTAEHFYGGRYRIVPNGVDLTAVHAVAGRTRAGEETLRLLYLGRAEERKGLSVLLRAFETLRARGVAARLTVAGASREEIRPLVLETDGLDLIGPVKEAEKWRLLGDADVLCAPSLGAESFGMVLVEALASSTAVVCSSIAGYRGIVRDGVEGLLVPPGCADRLAEALAGLASDRARLAHMGAAGRARAQRFAWPRVTDEVLTAYEDALAVAVPDGRLRRAGARLGVIPADGLPPRPPRSPWRPADSAEPADQPSGGRSLDATAPAGASTATRGATPRVPSGRRVPAIGALAVAAALAAAAFAAVGPERLVTAVLGAAPLAIAGALVLMSLSLLVRAEAWTAILRASLPEGARVRRTDTARATMIGVLMSATLPARLGELSRCLVLARRLGRVRERLPLVAGTVASQTLLNLLALALLGSVVVATVSLFRGAVGGFVLATLAPAAALLLLVAAPTLANATSARSGRALVSRVADAAARTLAEVRGGFAVFAHPRLGGWATLAQLSAWGLQWLGCYLLLVALGLDAQAGLGAAAAVLFAVNLAGALPVVPANLGVFQAACVAVLVAYGIDSVDALAYGIVLQALELTIAVGFGAPALLGEGLSWRQMRLRALSAAPLDLPSRPEVRPGAAG